MTTPTIPGHRRAYMRQFPTRGHGAGFVQIVRVYSDDEPVDMLAATDETRDALAKELVALMRLQDWSLELQVMNMREALDAVLGPIGGSEA